MLFNGIEKEGEREGERLQCIKLKYAEVYLFFPFSAWQAKLAAWEAEVAKRDSGVELAKWKAGQERAKNDVAQNEKQLEDATAQLVRKTSKESLQTLLH